MAHIEDVPIDDGTGLIYSVSVTPLIPRNRAGPGLHFRALPEADDRHAHVGEFLYTEVLCADVSGIMSHHPGQRIAEHLDGLGIHARARDAIVGIFCDIYCTEEDYSTEMLARVHIYTCYEDEHEYEMEDVVGLPPVGLDTEEKSCAICLEEFLSGLKVIELPCSHVYHEHCIVRWLEKRRDCPLCRYEV